MSELARAACPYCKWTHEGAPNVETAIDHVRWHIKREHSDRDPEAANVTTSSYMARRPRPEATQ